MLCDGCPRAYHLACMRGVAWGDLPAGEWHCPRCAERRGAALRKLAEFEARKHEALERWGWPCCLLCFCWLSFEACRCRAAVSSLI